MNWLNRLPGFERSLPGREWALWKRLPAILGWGTALPLAVAFCFWWLAPALPTAGEDRALWLVIYGLFGLVILHWTLVLTVAIGCAIVMVMKGPAFVADAYPPPGRET
jgi:hypothetical protein